MTSLLSSSPAGTIICMKWGTRYGPEFVNRLYAGIRRHTQMPIRFICMTDNADGLHPGVHVYPLPAIDIPSHVDRVKPWPKLAVWQSPLFDITGDVLFLDIDMVVTGPLDDFFTYEPGEYCVIENWTQLGQGIGNTSVFRFPVGRYKKIYDDFAADPMAVMRDYKIEQQYISAMIPEQKFWPREWCVSFKHSCIPPFPLNWMKTPTLPNGARLVAFTGKPDPDEAAVGAWPAVWYKKVYKHIRPVNWITENWQDPDVDANGSNPSLKKGI